MRRGRIQKALEIKLINDEKIINLENEIRKISRSRKTQDITRTMKDFLCYIPRTHRVHVEYKNSKVNVYLREG